MQHFKLYFYTMTVICFIPAGNKERRHAWMADDAEHTGNVHSAKTEIKCRCCECKRPWLAAELLICKFTAGGRGYVLNKETFARLVIDSTDSLYRVSKSILRNDSDCEDAVGEAITIAFQKLDSLKKDEYAKTWLTRILIHECYHILRQQSRITLVSDDSEAIWNYEGHRGNKCYMDVESYSDLYEAMEQLKENQRLVITLFYYEGYSIKEIAAILRITQGTVKSRLGRARNQLKSFLKEEESYV